MVFSDVTSRSGSYLFVTAIFNCLLELFAILYYKKLFYITSFPMKKKGLLDCFSSKRLEASRIMSSWIQENLQIDYKVFHVQKEKILQDLHFWLFE